MVVSELSRAAFETATLQSVHESFEFSDLQNTTFQPPSNLSRDGLARWAVGIAFTAIIPNSIFDAFGYKNPETDEYFHSLEDFIGNHTYVRGGTPTQFTTKFVDRFSQRINLLTKLLAGNLKPYGWKSEDMIILTNGICGSSCALITQRMSEKYNVSTVAVGGYKDMPLSYASFPGSQVYSLLDLYDDLEGIDGFLQNETLKDLIPPLFMIRADLTFTIKEAYDVVDEDRVLDYTFKPSKYRLYYNEQSAKDPSLLWLEAAKLFDIEG